MHSRAIGWLTVFFLLVANAHAGLREVDPGETPKLGGNEGLLVVSVDADAALGGLRIQRSGSLSATLLKDIKPGVRRVQLYVAPAGDYYFDHLSIGSTGSLQFKLSDNPLMRFTVKAATVNYPGDLRYRNGYWLTASISMINHGLAAMDWMATTHPLLHDYAFRYCGSYPDPFPDFYAAQSLGRDAAAARSAVFAAPEKAAIDVEPLWRAGRIRLVRLNPAGDLVAELVKEGDVWIVDLVDLRQSVAIRLIRTEAAVTYLDWKGDRTLMLGVKIDAGGDSVRAVFIDGAQSGKVQARMVEMPRRGYVVDLLASDPSALLFGSRGRNGQMLVHRIDVSSEAAIRAADFVEERRVNKGIDDGREWFADASGRLRAALVVRNGQPTLLYGGDGTYHEVKMPGSDGAFRPMSLSPDGATIYGLWDGDRAQRDLVAFDPATGAIGATLFSKPGIDIEAPLADRRKNVIGATYYRDGRLVTDYFDAGRGQLSERVAQAFPGESAFVIDRNDAQDQLLIGVESATRPPSVFHLDVKRKEASLLDDAYPWLAGRTWAPTHAVHAVGTDGLPIEAYLTMPPGDAKTSRPLVVLAHGGPIGTRDTIRFDPEVQLISSLGYAVLQVNFRGSEGYGRSFRDAGKGHYGSLIEDDIAAALAAALAAYPLDERRMCAMGSSYGGYSSMISAIRQPERYRCVISLFGLTDLPLFFTASDTGGSLKGRDVLADWVGDPRADLAGATRVSPLYRYTELVAPLMLVYGDLDSRVDPEHARRLARMLALAGRPPRVIELQDAAHGMTKPEQRAAVWPAVIHFLKQQLGEP